MNSLWARPSSNVGGEHPLLLDDVPGFQCEDLSVFSVAEWEKFKEQLILETWLAKARSQ